MDLPFAKEALKNLFSKPSCNMYPVKESVAFPNYRGKIKFYPEKCVNCGMCERVCAAGAITRTIEKCEEGDKITMTFNMGSCTFCSTCADFCSRHSIELTTDYHMIAREEEDLWVSGTFVKAAVKKPTPKPAPEAPAKAEEAVLKSDTAAAVQPREDGKPVSDPSRCVYCTLCAKKCPVGALEVNRAEKTWKLDEEKCIGCGTCADACPKKCILL